KKEIATTQVRGVKFELDGMTLAGILGVPGNNRICEYIKKVWEDSVYCKPLEISKKFVNDDMITEGRRVKSTEMKPFQRFLHFLVTKNVVPRFGKRDTTSFIDLTYMDHLVTRRLVNLPRVMLRHMAYVVSVPTHDLPYGDWLTMVFKAFNVPLIDKQGEEPKRYDFFEETFLIMCQLKRENGVWWLGSGENRRRDDEEVALVENEEVNEEEEVQNNFDREAVVDEATLQGEFGSGKKFFDAEDEVQKSVEVSEKVPDVPALASVQFQEKAPAGVDPSVPTGSIRDFVFMSLQAEFERARADRIQTDLERAQAENTRLLALVQQAQSQPKPYDFTC
ncbi:hypothetical protein Dimus_030338, partial [Dionaea muscipula]